MRGDDFSAGVEPGTTEVWQVQDAAAISVGGNRIFSAEFSREGADLILENPGLPDLRLVDFFSQDVPPDLVAENGAVLRGAIVARLAGPLAPGQYAQAGDSIGADPIGQVETVDGSAFAQRTDGTRVALDPGTKIFANDVLITEDGKLSVTFVDGTIFTLAADSRMVIDNLIYDPTSEDGNSGAFSLVEGGFVFIAGQVAKTGGMEVETPTATMGIRGTTVLVNITTVDGVSTVEVSLNADPDGGIGVIELRDLDGNLLATIDSTDSKWIVEPEGGDTREVIRTTDDLATDQEILLDAARAFALAVERVDTGGTFVELTTTPVTAPTVSSGDGTEVEGSDSDPDPTTPPPSTGTSGGDEGSEGDEGGDPPPAPTNTDPVATGDAATAVSDGSAISGNVLTNDSDADSDPLIVIVNSTPDHGTLDLEADGDFTYTPDPGFDGTDSFFYTISDGNGGTDTATVSFTVTAPVNTAPVANDAAVTVDEDAVVTIVPVTSDADGDSVSVLSATNGTHGTVALDGSGHPVYTPNADRNGTDSFTYTVSDGNGGTDVATVSVTVSPVNDAPVAADQTITLDEDTSASVTPSASDVDGDTPSLLSFSQPTNGAVLETAAGDLSYTPDADFNGTDSFSYTVSDGNGSTDVATVSVTVSSVNDAPVAADQTITLDEDTSASVTPSASDVDGDTPSLLSFSQPTNGAVLETAAGDLSYTPDADFNGTDSFTYTVSDGNGGTDVATVSVTVSPVGDAPVAADQAITLDEDTSASVTPSATDVDGDTPSLLSFSQPTNGAVLETAAGDLSYTPDADFNGTDSFTYTVSDGNGGSDVATVSVTVSPVNDAPVAANQAITLDEDTTASVALNATDVDGDTPEISGFTQGSDGTVSEDGEGGLVYTPDADFNGTDSFTYTVSDGQSGTDTVTVSVTVDPVADAPIGTDQSFTLSEDTAQNVPLSGSDPDGDALSIVSFGAATNGSVSFDNEGGLVYEPDQDFNGTDSFTYTISDGQSGTDSVTVTLTVNPVNDAPELKDQIFDASQDVQLEGVLAAQDVDGDALTYAVGTGPANGDLALQSDGSFTYTGSEGFTGTDTFTVVVSDGQGGSDTATMTVEVDNAEFTDESGQTVALGISRDPVGTAPAGNVRIDVSEVQSSVINLSFALDTSGSVGTAGWQDIEDAVHDAISSLTDTFVGSTTTVNVHIAQYGSSVTAEGTFELNTQSQALLNWIEALYHRGGGTYWELPINAAKTFFDAHDTSGATNILFFITDGVPSGTGWQAALAGLEGAAYEVDIQAFGIGAGFGTASLIAVDSDDAPVDVSTTGGLAGAIEASPFFSAELVDFSLSVTVDDGGPEVLADINSPALTPDGLNFDLALAELAGIGAILGDDNLFSASATFDLDGDTNTLGDRITVNSLELISKSTDARNVDGTNKSDLLLGSDLNDDLDGKGGDDVLLGFAGVDLLSGEAGNDVLVDDLADGTYDGGTGRDTLRITGTTSTDLIPTLSATDIEAVDLDNGVANTLNVTLGDVQNISSEADSLLESLLSNTLADSATILGDTNDSVSLLAGDASGTWVNAKPGVSDGVGNTLDIYQFMSGATVLATLGIDEDIFVNNLTGLAAARVE